MGLRPESSVSAELDEYGEIVFAGDAPGPVVHRTPEELGIPRVVPDVPVRVLPNVRPDFEDEKRIRSQSRRVGVRKDAPRRERYVRPERDEQQQEQLQILRVAQDDKVLGESEMSQRKKPSEELRKQVIAAAGEYSVEGLRKKFGIAWLTVKTILEEAGVPAKGGVKRGPRAEKPKAASTGLQRVTIDPKREGTAAALIGALARRDAAAAPAVRIELSQAEVAALVGKLSDEQRGAFLAAGLKAAILG